MGQFYDPYPIYLPTNAFAVTQPINSSLRIATFFITSTLQRN